MQTAQLGDRVHIHYVKRFQSGSVVSSRDRAPLELTVGSDHRRLPGLGTALVGLAPGKSTMIKVPAESAYGMADPGRVRRWSRNRFPKAHPLTAGKWVRISSSQGRQRAVRIVEVQGPMVMVDTNHRWAGQSMELEVYLISIQVPGPSSAVDES